MTWDWGKNLKSQSTNQFVSVCVEIAPKQVVLCNTGHHGQNYTNDNGRQYLQCLILLSDSYLDIKMQGYKKPHTLVEAMQPLWTVAWHSE